MPRDIAELDQTAMRLRASWAKANNYFASLAREFVQTKAAFDAGHYAPWTFSRWLIEKTGLVEANMVERLTLFTRQMAFEERQKLAEQRDDIQRERRAAAVRRQAAAAEVAAAKKAHAAEVKAAKDATRAERAAAKAKRLAEARIAKRRVKARERYAARRKRGERGEQGEHHPAVAQTAELSAELVTRIKDGQAAAALGKRTWLEGIMQQATGLYEARLMFAQDTEFSAWLTKHGIDYDKNTRAALIQIGEHPVTSRQVLEQTDRTSVRLIWEREIEPMLFTQPGLPEVDPAVH